MLGLAFAALSALALSGTEVTYEASLREEIRIRPSQPGDPGTASTAADDALIPTVGMGITSTFTRFALVYDPQLLFVDPYAEWDFQVLERGRAQLDLGRGTDPLHLTLLAEAQYGQADFLTLTNGATVGGVSTVSPTSPSVERVPPLTSILFENYDALGRLSDRFTERLSLDLTGQYLITGGADTVAQETIPLQKGPVATFDAVYRATRVDTLTSTLQGEDSDFSNGNHLYLGQTSETWRRQLNESSDLSGTVGGAVVGLKRPTDADYEIHPYPVISGEFVERLIDHRVEKGSGHKLDRLELRIDASVAPYIDRITGLDYERAEVTGALKAVLDKRWTVTLDEGASIGLWGDGVAEAPPLLISGAGLEVEVAKWLLCEAGLRGVWEAPVGGNPSAFEWVGFLAATVRTEGKL